MIYLVTGYYYSDKIALSSVSAKPADPRLHKQYYDLVEGLTLASGLPMPKLYVMNDNNINAFATGRNPKNAVICVTTGALEKLDKKELEGVLAHELGHIASFDIRFMTLTAVLVGMIAIISEIYLRSLWMNSRDSDSKGNIIFIIIGIVLAILAPLLTQLIQLAISRKREFAADATAVRFTRYPDGLISALKKIDSTYSENQSSEKKKIPKALAPLFISTPYKESLMNLFSTHPPIKARVSALERM